MSKCPFNENNQCETCNLNESYNLVDLDNKFYDCVFILIYKELFEIRCKQDIIIEWHKIIIGKIEELKEGRD